MLYDVIVVGGGTSGVAASIGVAKIGKKVLLLEKNYYLGGNATNSGVAVFGGFYAGTTTTQVVKGVGQMVLDKLVELGENVGTYEGNIYSHGIITFDMEQMKYALEKLVTEAGVELLFGATVVSCDVKNGRIASITYDDDCGLHTVYGKNFIDASGDAKLSYISGNEVIQGPELTQTATLVMWLDGVDPNQEIDDDEVNAAILRAVEEGYGPVSKLRSHMWKAKHGTRLFMMFPNYFLKDISAEGLTKAELNTREQAHTYVSIFRKYVKGMENCYLSSTGPKIGIRESRRVMCKKMLMSEDMIKDVTYDDSIAIGGWPIEVHTDISRPSFYIKEFDDKGFQIPLGCLKARDIENLWCCGRIICSDQYALASVRIMASCFSTGHAAGVAAALAGEDGQCDINAVRTELLKQGALI